MFDLRFTLLRFRLEGALARAPKEVTQEVGIAFRKIGNQFVRWMQQNRLAKPGGTTRGRGGRYTSNRFRDPRPGLFKRSGFLSKGLISRTDGLGNINSLKTTMGWLDRRSAMIAGVHEYGATIRPKNGPYLVFPVEGSNLPSGVARGGSSGAFVRVREVKIPPRLEFRKSFNSEEFAQRRLTLISEAIENGLNRAGL